MLFGQTAACFSFPRPSRREGTCSRHSRGEATMLLWLQLPSTLKVGNTNPRGPSAWAFSRLAVISMTDAQCHFQDIRHDKRHCHRLAVAHGTNFCLLCSMVLRLLSCAMYCPLCSNSRPSVGRRQVRVPFLCCRCRQGIEHLNDSQNSVLSTITHLFRIMLLPSSSAKCLPFLPSVWAISLHGEVATQI